MTILSADRQDTEQWRIARLKQAHSRFVAVLLALGREDWEPNGLVALHDCRGVLTAMWRSERAMAASASIIDLVWNSLCEAATEHVVGDDEPADAGLCS